MDSSIELNKIYNEDCLLTMARMPDNFLDLTVTSPPYDNIRAYKGFSWDFEKTSKELYRVTKRGGGIIWVVADQTTKGSESGTSFKQALFFKDCGFNIHDTMIYRKINYVPLTHNRYEQEFEYMFVLFKGKPKTFNPIMKECKTAGTKTNKRTFYQTSSQDTPTIGHKNDEVKQLKISGNVWDLSTNCGVKGHPAQFPEEIPNRHIISWSNPQDIVYDPFMGSGTTAKMAKLLGRNYIGSEMSAEYCKIAEERIKCAV